MNRNSVIIKSNPYGLILLLDPDVPFEDLVRDVGEKFRQGDKFFKNAQMALTFRGRVLTRAQERELADAITEHSRIRIVCLVDEQKEEEEFYKEAVTRALEVHEEENGQFYRGTLRSGQVLETDRSVVVLGDVNPGAQVISRGNVVILGCCMGDVYAGASGNSGCFAAALVMKPRQVRIGDKTARSAITKKTDTGEYAVDPKIVFIRDGHLVMEPLSGKSFSERETPGEKPGSSGS
ncbi:MAG TPA: septum site-determining protein MinC [Candidatus Merdiplasma excrementigallinarum]|uniref:Probable septum site-determining protein MinC n=1 Tax=Candidatus Merdiplasma excrementigallinarum TaxID=2840864 RepID=A0A9D1T8B4_9FIRM|nr:septum site-determining protein MinC [Candidatus Merdiplasma excrementigallinarum]